MLDQFETKNLFQLQAELIDRKIDMAASRSIDKVIEQIHLLRAETSKEFEKVREELKLSRTETSQEFEKVKDNLHRVEQRVIAVETKLGMVNERQRDLRS